MMTSVYARQQSLCEHTSSHLLFSTLGVHLALSTILLCFLLHRIFLPFLEFLQLHIAHFLGAWETKVTHSCQNHNLFNNLAITTETLQSKVLQLTLDDLYIFFKTNIVLSQLKTFLEFTF